MRWVALAFAFGRTNVCSVRPTNSGAPLHVVYLDHVARMSGGEIALLRLVPYLDRVRAHVILAEGGPLLERFHEAGVAAEVIPLAEGARDLRRSEVHPRGISPGAAVSTVVYVLRLAYRLRRLKPDLIHTNSLKAGVYGSLAARLAGVPLVWHIRDRIDVDYLPTYAVRLVRFMTRRLAAAVVANSESTLETLDVPKTSMVRYSVLPEVLRHTPRPRMDGTGPLTFGVLGRLAPWKGQDMFLRAFARAFPDGEERAVIIGGALFGEHDYERGLVDLARSLGIADRVEFRGQREDVWDELTRIDVLVHSSVTPEPFGQVLLEGMAAGVPVIAADAGGPSEILTHEETGLLYRMRDAEALAMAMQRMHDAELRARLVGAARASLRRYSPEVVVGQLQDLYEQVFARRSRRP